MKGEQQQELHLRELLYQILKGWRLLAVWAVVMALVLTGFQFMMALKSYRGVQAQTPTTTTREELEEALSDTQLLKVEEAWSLQSLIEEKEAYLSRSPYLAIDPYAEHLVTLMYYVKTENHLDFAGGVITGDGGELAKAYTETVNHRLYEQLNQADAGYYNEVVTAKRVENSLYQFTVLVKGATETDAKQLAQKVKPVVESVKDTLAATVEAHTLQLLDETHSLTVDKELADKKELFVVGLNKNKSDLNTLVDDFSTAQRELYEFSGDAQPAQPEQQEQQNASPARPRPSVKYCIVGALLGIIIAGTWLTLSYMLGTRLRKPEELTEIYELAALGTLATPVKKKVFSFVDRLIDKLFRKERWTAEERAAFTLSNLKMVCAKEGLNHLTVVTNLSPDAQEQETLSRLEDQLKEAGVTLALCRNIHKDAGQYEQVCDCDGVILLEKEGVSRYSAIGQKLALLSRAGVSVLGAVTFVQ